MSTYSYKHKLVITDFDGTLSAPDSSIYPDVVEYIQALRKRGVRFAIATGRAYFGHLRSMIHMLELETPQITYGGAELRNPEDDSIVWKSHLKAEHISHIQAFLDERKYDYAIEKDEFIYTNIDPKTIDEVDQPRCRPVSDFLTDGAPKIIVPAIPAEDPAVSEAKLQEIESFVKNLSSEIHAARIIWDDAYGLDITAATGTKHYGALELMRILGIPREEVIGIGDSFNDFPLLNAVGTSVAMGNAPDELKEFADDITLHRDRGGFLAFLKKYFPLDQE